eukprot:COSAG02_NODE_19034_length_903_cov_3.767413_1_plen_51_part_10
MSQLTSHIKTYSVDTGYTCEFMFISHESGHCPKEKLVVSPAVNQVVQSLLD